MNQKVKKLLLDWRIMLFVFVLLCAFLVIHPNPWNKGVVIRSVRPESSAYIAGIRGPTANQQPMSRERILFINNIPIKNVNDYYSVVNEFTYNQTVVVKTTKATYKLITKPIVERIPLGEKENQTIVEEIFDNETNETRNITRTVEVEKFKEEVKGVEDIGLRVYNAPKSNIKFGIDIEGGIRIILKAVEKNATPEDFQITIDNLKQRINVYGLSDITIREASDLSGNNYIIVEVAGINEEDVLALIKSQGKFEAKISNETVFMGSDIKYVCMSSECSGIDPMQGCFKSSDGNYYCKFRFSVSLSQEAADKQAQATSKLDVVSEGGESYLSQNIDFYLDDKLVDSLRIAADLKGKKATEIMITGYGSGLNNEDALNEAIKNMKRLQTIIQTGLLPLKLEIVSQDTITPSLGQKFIKNIMLMTLFAFLTVSLIIYLFYKRIKLIIPIMLTSISELVITISVLSLLNWNIDLAAIAGLIASIGSGVDHQIIITDEALKGESRKAYTWAQKIKGAFSIITGSYLTTLFAMIPLMLAGAGLLRGFAITIIVGITVGVLITRPTYAKIVEVLTSK
ncbi:MAG: MMPL family transporter [Candidatus Woesearchaeota archaeon]